MDLADSLPRWPRITAFFSSRVRPWLSERRYRLAATLVCGLVAIGLFTHGGQDDTYITYWPARALADHGRLVNYNGDHLEQSSSLSLVLLLAVLYKLLPLSMPTVGYLTGVGLGGVTLMLGARLAQGAGVRAPALIIPAMGTVLSFAYWSTSGMETTLLTAAAFWVILELERLREGGEGVARWRLPAACLCFVGARPESPFVLLGLIVALAVATGWARVRRAEPLFAPRALGRAALTAVLAVALLLAFRKLYFHSWVPNPATVKAAGFNVKEGLEYAWEGFMLNGPHLLALLLLGVGAVAVLTVRARLLHPSVLLVTSLGAAQVGFAVMSGGDWMSGARFLAPAMPALVLAPFLAVAPWLATRLAVGSVAALVATANLVCALQFVHHGDAEGRPLWTVRGLGKALKARFGANGFASVELGNKLHLRDAGTIAKLLPIVERVAAKKGSPISIMTGQAGMMGYHVMSRYYGRVRLLDMWSLTSRDLYNCFPAGSLGGSKWGTFMSMEGAFSLLEGGKCGAQAPEIYYNECLTSDARQTLKKHGYVVLYNQVGTVKNSPDDLLYPGQTAACGHIAVRKEYVDSLDLKTDPDWAWDIMGR